MHNKIKLTTLSVLSVLIPVIRKQYKEPYITYNCTLQKKKCSFLCFYLYVFEIFFLENTSTKNKKYKQYTVYTNNVNY